MEEGEEGTVGCEAEGYDGEEGLHCAQRGHVVERHFGWLGRWLIRQRAMFSW